MLLDNVEQVIHHMPHTVGRWMSLAPHTRFLVTSRHALQLPGERLLDLAPLGLPAEGEARLEELARSEAVQLFVQRARAVRGSFALTEQEAPLVADIVRRLDGIALAIELAAARTSLLSIQQLRHRLSRRFELLRGGLRESSHRQATLRGAIDWSWNLLEASEQEALAQCSVFHGGFTMEAAEAVLALPPWGADILDTLQSLRSKSLLRLAAPESTGGELRLGMYESIREYACARLAETASGATIAARHAEYYVTLARGLRDQVRGGGGLEALRALARERENLLAACDSCLTRVPGTSESLTRALLGLVALEPDVAARGPAGLLLPRLNLALELAESVPVEPMLRAEALAVRGRAHLEAGQLAFARRDLEAARDAFHTLGAMEWKKEALVDLSIVARHEGDMGAAWSLIQEAQTIPSGGRRWLEAYALGNLGLVEQSRQGAAAAIPHLRAALELFRAVGDTTFEAMFLVNCGLAIGEAGRATEAVPYLEEGLAKALSAGYRMGHIVARMDLGCILLGEDRAAEACEHLAAAERMGRQLGVRLLEGMTQGELGRALLAVGSVEPGPDAAERGRGGAGAGVPLARSAVLRVPRGGAGAGGSADGGTPGLRGAGGSPRAPGGAGPARPHVLAARHGGGGGAANRAPRQRGGTAGGAAASAAAGAGPECSGGGGFVRSARRPPAAGALARAPGIAAPGAAATGRGHSPRGSCSRWCPIHTTPRPGRRRRRTCRCPEAGCAWTAPCRSSRRSCTSNRRACCCPACSCCCHRRCPR